MENTPQKKKRSLFKRILKGIGVFIGSILGLALILILIFVIYSYSQFYKTYDIPDETVSVPIGDEAAIARGKILARYVRCTECHGDDMSGVLWVDQWYLGHWGPSNLTTGAGSRILDYTDEDFVRAIRHGVNPDGKPLVYMPAHFYTPLSREDTEAIIAYIRSLPPVDTDEIPNTTGPLLWGYALREPAGLPAKHIDHSLPFPDVPERGATVAYGEYMSQACRSCHADDMSGRERLERVGVMGPNVTMAGLAGWTEEEFYTAMKTGVVPNGRNLSPLTMPWESIGQLGDDELTALWLYIQSLPPVTNEFIRESK